MIERFKAKIKERVREEVKEDIKENIRKNKTVYYCVGTGIAIAGITVVIMRGVTTQPISRDVIVTAGRDSIVTRKKVVLNNISFISAERQGPPSWVVRCKETGVIFTSQRSAANEMGILETNISRQLNGLKEHVDGYHFERICMAA